MMPPLTVEPCGGFLIVRDDRVPGGTKQRVLMDMLRPGVEYVYASPAYGYAQIALATAATALGARATVFTAKRATPHARTQQAKAAGAKVVMVPHGYLSNVQAKARAYAAATGATLMPFGFDTPDFLARLAAIARSLDVAPAEVWCVAGSGTLARALQQAWPQARFCVVQVGKALDISGMRMYRAPEAFEQNARQRPPFPSCSNYDAKVWQFMTRYGTPGALCWNVAA